MGIDAGRKKAGAGGPCDRHRCAFKPSTWLLLIEAGLGGAVLLVMLGLWWALEPSPTGQNDSGALCDRAAYPPPWELRADQLTILVNGFAEARIPLLQASVQAYSASPAVHSVLVLWGNTSTPDALLLGAQFESMGAPVYVVRQKSRSLNDRFLPRDYIRTKAVMICDDDITVDASSLEFALKVWRENQRRIVGFFPRAHSFQLDSHSWIYTKHEHKYSIMLTKTMLLATDYLFRYTCAMPPGVREYVDRGMNCEDIAMNFLVSNSSGLGPLLVEGEPRDWGDTRNSEEGLSAMGLSARADHRKDRGDCILEFQRLWNGMELRFSSAKAVSHVEEQALCEKFGQLVDCDKHAGSVRDARRLVGHDRVTRTYRYAYATLLLSKRLLPAALVLAQSLRNTGTPHDLVLLLDAAHCGGVARDDRTLNEHFDLVKEVGRRGKLEAWRLQEYERVVFLDVSLLVLTNVDGLFELPEPAAAPQVGRPDQLSAGLLVLRPSNATYTALLASTEDEEGVAADDDALLNGFFSGWYQMPWEHRLPMHFNMPVHLAPATANETAGVPAVLRFPRQDLAAAAAASSPLPPHAREVGAHGSAWLSVWRELLDALRRNEYQPLDDDTASRLSWRPREAAAWPPQLQLPSPPLRPRGRPRTAFATVVWSAEQLVAVAGWATTYAKLHAPPSRRHETLLLVHASVAPAGWRPHGRLFDAVAVVGGAGAPAAAILHLWNQTSYDKLVYVDPGSLFIDNCNFLMEFEPFAAAPNPVLPDTFALQVMVVQPDGRQFSKLLRGSRGRPPPPLAGLLNREFGFWYQSSPQHRIGAVWNSERDLRRGLAEVDGRPWKLLSFPSTGVVWDAATASGAVWRKWVCGGQSSAGGAGALLGPACEGTPNGHRPF